MNVPNLEARNARIERHMPLARSVAASKKKTLRHVDIDELRSAAYLGLVEAAERYDLGKSRGEGGFAGYAVCRIRGAVQDYLRSLGFGSRGSVSRGCRWFATLEDFSR